MKAMRESTVISIGWSSFLGIPMMRVKMGSLLGCAVPLFIHPYKDWIFILAPGFDYRQDRHDFLFRAGVAYEFEIDRWSISPLFNVDFVDGEQVLVYGVSFGYGF
jgi:hypothetical protein